MYNNLTLPGTKCLCLRGSIQSVWTTRQCIWCPSPATANRSASLPWATGPSGTPAFQEPGSTSQCFILAVSRFAFSFTRSKHSWLWICSVAKYSNKLCLWNELCESERVSCNFPPELNLFSLMILALSCSLITPNNTEAGNNGLWCQSWVLRSASCFNFLWLARTRVRSRSQIVVRNLTNNKVFLQWPGPMEFFHNAGWPRWMVSLLKKKKT